MFYICKECGKQYANDRKMKVSTITTNGGCDWPDTDIYYNCECGELLGCNDQWYCTKGVTND